MGLFSKLFGTEKFENIGSQLEKDGDAMSYKQLLAKKQAFEDILLYKAPSHEEFVERVKQEKEKQLKKYKSPYLERYNKFMDEAKKLGYDEELMNTLDSSPTIFRIKDLDRISRLERSYIEHTGFNRDAFPAGTELLFFDEIFEEIYTTENYENKKEHIVQYVDEYLHDKGIQQCCIKIGQEEYIYAYKNNVEADAVEYNFSLVDKNNNVKDKIIYEEDGKTVNNSIKLLAILQTEVEFLDLVHKKEFKEIGDIPRSTYTDPKLPYSDKVYIKNQILIDLFESKKYDKESLEIFRNALRDDIDIGYILNPCYTAFQRKQILQILKDYEDEKDILRDLRKFSVQTGTHFTKSFTDNQFGYMLECVQNGDVDDFKSLEKLAQMDLEYYKDMALASDSNSFMFTPEGSDKTFILTKEPKHEGYNDFRLEKVEFNEDGKITGQYLIYEKCGENETPREGLEELLTELQKGHLDRDSKTIFDEAFAEVVETISDIEKHGHVHILYTEDSSIVQIEGIRSERKELTEDEEMAIFLGGQRKENTIEKEDAGVVISVIKDGKEEILYSDDPKRKAIYDNIDDAFVNIINKHGSLNGRQDIRTSPIVVNNNETLSESIEREKNLLYKEKYKTSSQKMLEQAMNLTMKKKIRSMLSSNDNEVTLLFEPYTVKDGSDKTYSNCNIYKIEDGEKVPVFVKTLDENGIEHISGDLEDAIDIILKNDFDIRDSGSILPKNPTR